VPIYDYTCSACGHLTEVIHGVHDAGPHFCPDCGAEGTMKKQLATPAIHFKGTGWAKKERRGSSSSTPKSDSSSTSSATGDD
jgi:putative FmdB family regulatory protein